MRLLLAAVAVVLAVPGTAAAAPWVETPFLPLGHDRTVTCLQATGPGGAAYLAEDHAGDGRERVELLRVGAGGTLAPDGSVTARAFFDCPAVATAPSGAAVAAAPAVDRRATAIGIAVRDAGAAFGRPLLIERGAHLAGGFVAAIAADGAAVVAWTETELRDGELRTRIRVVRRAPGATLGRPETVSTRGAAFSDAYAGIDERGRAVVAWLGRRANGRYVAWVATAAGPGAPFAAPERLGPGEDYIGGLSLAVAPGGGVLVAHDSFDGIRVFERPQGAPRFVRAADFPADFDREDPVAALADDGTAAVGWTLDDERFDDVPEIALRPPGGAFAPARRLGADALAGAAPAFEVADDDRALQLAAGPAGAVTAAWLERPLGPGDDAPARIALASADAGGAWHDATLFGSQARSAADLTLLSTPPALLWADNLHDPDFDLDEEPRAAGRVHVAAPGAPAPPALPLPALTLSARAQSVRAGDPLFIRARCSAACDLRAVTRARDRVWEGPAGSGSAELGRAGTARIRLVSWSGDTLVPDHGGRPTIVVTATAPGGTTPVVRRIAVDARHAPVPPPRRPVDVRAVRDGARIVVTWRTLRPARAERFVVSPLRGGDVITSELALGGGRTRFRAVLERSRRARSVQIEWDSTEPRFPTRSLRVRLR